MLQGLAYLHRELHVIHRDVKPSNILVDTAGHIKIADFGVSGNLAHALAKCASWVGTVHYMSPERISGGSYSETKTATQVVEYVEAIVAAANDEAYNYVDASQCPSYGALAPLHEHDRAGVFSYGYNLTELDDRTLEAPAREDDSSRSATDIDDMGNGGDDDDSSHHKKRGGGGGGKSTSDGACSTLTEKGACQTSASCQWRAADSVCITKSGASRR